MLMWRQPPSAVEPGNARQVCCMHCCRALLDRTAEGGCPYMSIVGGIKDKRAAQGRRSGNHCGRHKIPRKISGNAGAGVQTGAAEAVSLFIRLQKFCLNRARLSRGLKKAGSVLFNLI